MYVENFYDVMSATEEKISTVIVPKNSGLKGYAWDVLKRAGLDLDAAEKAGRETLRVGGLTIIQKRGEDIPQLVVDYAVRRGELVLGVTGDDLYDEFRFRAPDSPLRVENTYDWFDEDAKFFRPALCFVSQSGRMEDVPLEAKVAVNSKYELTSRNYLDKSLLMKGRAFDVTVYNGDVEVTVAEGTTDCAIDTVYSGKTLKEARLSIVDIVRFSDLVVISPLKKDESLFGRASSTEYAQVLARLQNPTGSYTSKLLADPEGLARKGSEEMLELALAVIGVGKGQVAAEAADVMYALNMLIAKAGVTLEDVAREIIKRQK